MGAIPLTEAGSAIIYDGPTTSIHPYQIKKASYPKGFFPEHLKKFAGQIKVCPTRCKGKTGLSYSACLRSCAREVMGA